jgi:hypothetical protein
MFSEASKTKLDFLVSAATEPGCRAAANTAGELVLEFFGLHMNYECL